MNTPLPSQALTPHELSGLPSKDALRSKFNGKHLTELRTPAFVIDRSIFARNCAKMHESAKQWDADFRAHVKTHKTAEGTRMQLVSSAGRSRSVVISTLMEAWQIVLSGLVSDGTVEDILYGLPISPSKIQDVDVLSKELRKHGAVLRLMIDHPDQIRALETFNNSIGRKEPWSVFIKVDFGKRAGVTPLSPLFAELINTITRSNFISIFGFYCHAGGSYKSSSLSDASSFLSAEVEAVNNAAKAALSQITGDELRKHERPFVLSVGATPTAHAFSSTNLATLKSLLSGKLELHAGNYPMLDLQQIATSLVTLPDVAQRVVASVVSLYPARGVDGENEALCDAGAIAFSKDTGPIEGFGAVVGVLGGEKKVVRMARLEESGWRLGRVSQEHGILVQTRTGETATPLGFGAYVEIIGQHACLEAAAFPWYYIVDSGAEGGFGDRVVDVWVPWKGW